MSGMDFFGHQERARLATRWLVLWFALAMVGITLAIYAAAVGLLVANEPGASAWQPEVLLAVAVLTLLVVGIGSLWKTAQLRSGGSKVAEMLGGRKVSIDTHEPHERQLRNVVEEMAIASGVPVPDIYVLDDEAALNAFAAGWTPSDAAIAVTRGCLEKLDRDELQGVIAHEFSHVFHGDMRLNIRLMGVLFGIVCITVIGRVLVRVVGRGAVRSSSGKGKGSAAGIMLFGVALVVIGWLGVLFARMIQAAVSRQREFLADASAVQYTRNPRGIGMALAKIGGLGGQLKSAQAEAASHLLFADGMRRFLGGALATHPPVETRVERILPGFRREFASAGSMTAAVAATPLPPAVAGLVGGAPGRVKGPGIATTDFVDSVGEPQERHVEAARELLRDLPLDVAAAAHEPERAAALVVAMLLDPQPARRQAQLAPLLQRDPNTAHEAGVLFQSLAAVGRHQRLPLVELAMPSLRALPEDRRRALREDCRALAMADAELSPFEWALLRTVERHVRVAAGPPPRRHGRPSALAQHPQETAIVLSVLARIGARGDGAAAARAFARGSRDLVAPAPPELLPPDRCSLVALEQAIDTLAAVSPLGKRNLLTACAEAAGADGHLDADEADLLRALAGLWDCPVPLVPAHSGADQPG